MSCRSLHIFIVLCVRFVNAATESGVTPTVDSNLTNWETSNSSTPAPSDVLNVTDTVNSTSVVTADLVFRAATAATILPVTTSDGDLHLQPVTNELKTVVRF